MYYIISSILCGTIIIGGRLWFGLNFIERIIALVVVGGLFEVIYQKIKVRWRNFFFLPLFYLVRYTQISCRQFIYSFVNQLFSFPFTSLLILLVVPATRPPYFCLISISLFNEKLYYSFFQHCLWNNCLVFSLWIYIWR